VSRRRALAVLLAAAAPITAAAGTAGAGSLDTKATAVGVAEREFRISPYRRTVPTGTLKFNVRNFGEDVHDLVVVSPKGRRLGTTGEIRAGNQAVLRLKLNSPGTYRLVCTQGDHAARGMKSRIVVRATRR
jgi:plastocyanin